VASRLTPHRVSYSSYPLVSNAAPDTRCWLIDIIEISHAITCSSSPYLISTQQDADYLYKCAGQNGRVNGNVTITTSAVGDLKFSNFGFIDGSLTAQNNPVLETLNIGPDAQLRQIELQNLTTFSALIADDFFFNESLPLDLALQDLPSLSTISMENLAFIGNLTLQNIPNLTHISLLESEEAAHPRCVVLGNIDIKDVGISSLDNIFQSGFKDKNFTIEGIPNVQTFAFTNFRTTNFRLQGNGNLSLAFDCSYCTVPTDITNEVSAGTVSVSGLGSIFRNHSVTALIGNLTIGTFIASNNSFTTLPIDFESLTSLYIQDNPNLTTLLFHENLRDYNFSDIVITGNPLLNLTASDLPDCLDDNNEPDGYWPPCYNGTHLGKDWIWPSIANIMIFDGPFDNDFL
jgi:hypothetical protein